MSIQQRIASDVYRMADRAITPDQIKAVQAHLVRSVQDGAVPSYVGVPLLNDLNQKMSRIQNASAQSQAMVQQPPIAQQVVGQAEQAARAPMQGVTGLPSGLPEEGMAGGGIVAFAGGGMSDGDMASYLLSDEEDDEEDYVKEILRDFQMSDAAKAMRHETGSEGLASIAPMLATSGKESMSIKEEGRPAQTAERKTSSITRPGGVEDLLKMIEQKESGGRGDYDKYGNLLTSPKGAMGRMQVMPGTVRDPGFGVAPARDSSPDELARVGRDYYKALLGRYNDPKIAAIAYNWGPGNTDKWLTAGADMGRLPAETRQYAQGFAEGGIASVKRFQYGGISATSPFSVSSLGLDDLKRMASMGESAAVEELAKRSAIDDLERRRISEGLKTPRAPSPSAAEMNLGNARVVGGAQPVAAEAAAIAPEAAQASRLYGPFRTAGSLVRGSIPAALGAEAIGNFGSYKFQEPGLDTSAGGVYDALKAGKYRQAGRNAIMGLPEAGLDLVRGAAGIGDYLLPGQPLASGVDRLVKGVWGSDISTPSDKLQAGAGRGTMPASSYNVPAAQAATQRPSMQKAPEPLSGIDLGGPGSSPATGWADNAPAAEEQKPEEAAGKEEGKPTGIRALLDQYRSDIGKEREINAYLSLLSAGLGMMGGTSPYGMANIGRGAQQGIGTYAQLGAQTAADRRALLGAEAALEKYGMLADIRKHQFESTQEGKIADREQKRVAASAEAIRRYEMQAENDSRLIAQERVKQASKDLINPITDEQRNAIYADERAKALARLRQNQMYLQHMKIAAPGYDPSQVALNESDNKILNKYLNTR